jgi:hypothetical protein
LTSGIPSAACDGLLASFHDKSLVTDALVRARFADRLRVDDGYTVARHLADHRVPYSVKELSEIRVPALFVWCREDEITPLKWGEAMRLRFRVRNSL